MMQQVDTTTDRAKIPQQRVPADLDKLTPWWKSRANLYTSSSDEELRDSNGEYVVDDSDSDREIDEVSGKNENRSSKEEDEQQIHYPQVKEEIENTWETESYHLSNDVNFPNNSNKMSVENMRFEENNQLFQGCEHAIQQVNNDKTREIQNNNETKLTNDTRGKRKGTVYYSTSYDMFDSSSDVHAAKKSKDKDFGSRDETDTSDNTEPRDGTNNIEKVNGMKDEEKEALEKLFRYKGHLEIITSIYNKCTYKCKICHHYYAVTASRILHHFILHDEGKLKCEQCQFNAPSEKTLQQHKEELHSQSKQKCDICGYTTHKVNLLKIHKAKVHTKEEDKKYICPHEGCCKRFALKNDLQSHMMIHKKIVLCEYCGKQYAFAKYLRQHIAREHDKNMQRRTIHCDICGKEYSANSRYNLKLHKMKYHFNETPLKCKYCPKTFVNPRLQIYHERTHTGEKPYNCKFCDFRAAKESQVEAHSRTHTGEKPFKCKECNYACTWRVQMKSHMKAHSSDTAVTCDICNVVFINEKSLQLHNKKFVVIHDGLSKKSTSLRPSVQI
ncbi:zinc finger protein 878-like [Ptychodera flava]|uniref:zinc finger protein 878-like n=1 Tax=Ptychodera flava TaxID=63121 RepID=UPI00396A4AEE